jgi:DNA-binding transcriptional regulator GbsR (MarR family)
MKPQSEKLSVLYDSMSRANMSHAVKVIKVKNLRVVQIVRNPQVREVNITFEACKQYAKKMNTMFAIADIGRMYVE